jgi:hypothetical protein
MSGFGQDQLTSRIQTLRGPIGGFAHRHPGLAAFWREQVREMGARAASEQEAAALERLRTWLSGQLPFALVMGDDEARRTTTLARFALSALERPDMTVVFLPVSACFGTAAEHDALQVLYGLLATPPSLLRGPPRSPNELRWAISEATRGDIAEGEPQLLVIVDGIERAADWDPDRGVHFLDGVGRGIHILVSAGEASADEDSSEWQRRLQWDRNRCFELNLAKESQDSEQLVAVARAALEAREEAALDMLAVCLAPIAPEELAVIGDCAPPSMQAASLVPDHLAALTVTDPDGAWHFRNDSFRSAWRAAVDTASVEDRLLRKATDLLEGESSAAATSEYLVRYAGTYCARTEVPLATWAAIGSPRWLAAWTRLDSGLIGYAADLRRARDAAQQVLIAGSSYEAESREALRLVVWCALLEGALFDAEASNREAQDPKPLARTPGLDLGLDPEARHARAAALFTLQSAVTGEERELISAWAAEAAAQLSADATVTPLSIPHWDSQQPRVPADPHSGEEFRSMSPVGLGVHIVNDAASVLAALGAEVTLRSATTAPASVRVAALANLVPHLPEPSRSLATDEALQAFREHPDRDALRALFACAPWMSYCDAAWLLCSEFGNDWHDGTLRDRLIGWAGITAMIPLLQRIGGFQALVDAAEAIARITHWSA